MLNALLLESDLRLALQLAPLLEARDFSLTTVSKTDDAVAEISRRFPNLLIISIDQKNHDWERVFENNDLSECLDVVLIDQIQEDEAIATGMRLCAIDYYSLPIDEQRFVSMLDDLVEENRESQDDDDLEAVVPECGRLKGRAAPILRLFRIIHKVAPTSVSVFLQGESGVGKELVAEAIHSLSEVADGPFVPVNCAAISPQLLESELFGHVKGAFTGANRSHVGFLERASGGTLFLDEITELDVELQVKLLRVLESRRFTKVGGEREQALDARVVAATNRKQFEAIQEGKLRQDLYYRLAQFPVRVPSLRERGKDILTLSQDFLAGFNEEYGQQKTLSKACLEVLQLREWPGNVRELKNALQQAYILADDCLEPEHLPTPIRLEAEADLGPEDIHQTHDGVNGSTVTAKVGESLEEVERKLLHATLSETGGDKTRAAEMLGVSVKTIYNMLKRHEASPE